MTRPWFGYEGVNNIDGFSVLAQPFGALGIAAFIAAVFYDFRSLKNAWRWDSSELPVCFYRKYIIFSLSLPEVLRESLSDFLE